MADTIIRFINIVDQQPVDVKAIDNGDGTYSLSVALGVGGEPVDVQVTPTTDTSDYASGDIIFDTTALAGFVVGSGNHAVLENIRIIEAQDQAAFSGYIYFLRSNVSMGTINSAPNISDANAKEIVGRIPFAISDWVDLGGCKELNLSSGAIGLPKRMKATTGTTLYIAMVATSDPGTFTASSMDVLCTFAPN